MQAMVLADGNVVKEMPRVLVCAQVINGEKKRKKLK